MPRVLLLLAAPLLLALPACSDGDEPPRSLPADPVPSETSDAPTSQSAPTSLTPSPLPSITVPSASPSPTATPSATPSATSSPEAPADPLASRPPLETPPPSGQPLCDSRDLTVTDSDAIITGTAVQELFVVRTTGPDCQLAGYPVVSLRDAAGAPVRASARPGGYGLPAERATAQTLSRGTSLSFVVASARSGDCVQAARLTVRLPGTTASLSTATSFSVCDGAVGISPVRRQTGPVE